MRKIQFILEKPTKLQNWVELASGCTGTLVQNTI